MNPARSTEQNKEQFLSLVNPHLERLREFVRHQLAYFESVGDLAPGALSADEIVDAVVLRAGQQFLNGTADPEIRSWLIQLAVERIHAEIRRLSSNRNTEVPLEKNVPLTPPARVVSTLGEEIFEFYQPDENLKLEDIFADFDVSTPEDFVAAKEELLHCVNAALAGMPKKWRQALRLRHVEGLTSEQLSEALEKDEPEIERILEYARQHLRESLIEAGCRFIVKDPKSEVRGTKRKKHRAGNTGPRSKKQRAKSGEQERGAERAEHNLNTRAVGATGRSPSKRGRDENG